MKHRLKKDYDFSNSNLITPDKVLQDICDELSEITSGLVTCNVKVYEGKIESYMQPSALTAMAVAMHVGGATKIDIQDKLGSIGEDLSFQFELLLTAKYIETYLYRIMFISYNLGGYPVKVVLEQGIADEINEEEDSDYIFLVDSKDEFEKFIVTVMNSKKVVGIVQDLITASQRKQKEQKDGRCLG